MGIFLSFSKDVKTEGLIGGDVDEKDNLKATKLFC